MHVKDVQWLQVGLYLPFVGRMNYLPSSWERRCETKLDSTQLNYSADDVLIAAKKRIEEINVWLPEVEKHDLDALEAYKTEKAKEKEKEDERVLKEKEWNVRNGGRWFAGTNPYSKEYDPYDFLSIRTEWPPFARAAHAKVRIDDLKRIITLAEANPVVMSLSVEMAEKVFVTFPKPHLP